MPAAERTLVTVLGAPRPNFDAYSLVVRSTGDTIHVAGFMGDDPETGKIVEGGVAAQADQAMKNIETCLKAAGSGVEKIVRRRMYFMNIKQDIKTVMDVWDRHVPKPQPVSTAVQISGLAKEGALIELEVEAEA
ncbi:hypothetical protein DOTSEDRAFT_39585 [Dothistroma septosporum NZE10]|uniref:YjgF-like protein n=1 Tax=Dothistroma septosporum (strain NZE10 / CBS 128990) TaxID=675120 RepID=M2XZB6_DOTSN|nr:hypothetical protein DOTSEDRAFT_39585 [Dothistroma septosporum NZE10]